LAASRSKRQDAGAGNEAAKSSLLSTEGGQLKSTELVDLFNASGGQDNSSEQLS